MGTETTEKGIFFSGLAAKCTHSGLTSIQMELCRLHLWHKYHSQCPHHAHNSRRTVHGEAFVVGDYLKELDHHSDRHYSTGISLWGLWVASNVHVPLCTLRETVLMVLYGFFDYDFLLHLLNNPDSHANTVVPIHFVHVLPHNVNHSLWCLMGIYD